MAALVAGGPPGKGRDISLAALRRHDPYITRIVDVASQVALYTFGHRANEWERTDVEGTLFVYTRSASPKHGFTIMNRLSMENRTEPITKDLDFQLQDPFLLYRNARLSIYGIWFYDKEECQRIAELMKNLTQYEQLKACQGTGVGVSPMTLSSGEGREVDILQMLTKAKDEYTKYKTCSEPKQITSSAICDNPNLIKPIPVKPSDKQQQQVPLPGQALDLEPQHLSLKALFGKQDKAPCKETVEPSRSVYQQAQQQQHPQQQPPQPQQQKRLTAQQDVIRSLSCEKPRRPSPPMEKQLCPAIQKLLDRNSKLHLLSEHPREKPCESSSPDPAEGALAGAVQSGSSWSAGTSHCTPSACKTNRLLEQLQSPSGAVHKYNPNTPAPASPSTTKGSFNFSAATQVTPVQVMTQPQPVYFNSPLLPAMPGHHQALGKEQCTLSNQALPFSGSQESSPRVPPPQELLRKLQGVQQEQQLQAAFRPALAARFPAAAQSSGTGKPLEAWVSRTANMEKQTPLLQTASPQRIPVPAAPTLLMPPVGFTQSTCAPPVETDRGLLPMRDQEPSAAAPSLLPPPQSWESSSVASRPLTKLQLQETLLSLVQNDDNFLSIIYEAYLFSVTQATVRKNT